jgi:predicted DNA-binding transcriptional regulator AlpA
MAEKQNPEIKEPTTARISGFDEMSDSALLIVQELVDLGIGSPATIWRDVHSGRLAAPIKIGPNRTRWRVGDVRKFINGGG